MRIIVAIVLLFGAGHSVADPQPWMKKENPNELAIFVNWDSECPFTKDEMQTAVEGVLTRSRINPSDNWLDDPVFLNVTMHCIDDPNTEWYIYETDVDYVVSHISGRFEHTMVFYDYGAYHAIGIATKGPIFDTIKELTKEAVTDYVKANFDL